MDLLEGIYQPEAAGSPSSHRRCVAVLLSQEACCANPGLRAPALQQRHAVPPPSSAGRPGTGPTLSPACADTWLVLSI